MKKILITFFALFLAILFCSSYASTYTFTATPDKSNVYPGDEVFVSLVISDIDAGNEGINVVETTLEYDTNIFEKVEFIDKNNWKSNYNSNSGDLFGKLLYSKMVSGVTSDEEIGVIKFTIKDNLSAFQTDIKFLQVTSNDGYILMNDGDKIIPITYKTANTPSKPTSPAVPDEPANPETPSNTITNTAPTPDSTPNSTPEKVEEPVKEENKTIIPNVQTGDIIWFVIVILVLAIIISVILYIYSKKHKKDINNKQK